MLLNQALEHGLDGQNIVLCTCYHNKENKLGWKVVSGAGSSVNPWGSLVFICIMFAHAPSSGRHKAAGKVPPSLGGNAGQSSVEEGGGVMGSDAALSRWCFPWAFPQDSRQPGAEQKGRQ